LQKYCKSWFCKTEFSLFRQFFFSQTYFWEVTKHDPKLILVSNILLEHPTGNSNIPWMVKNHSSHFSHASPGWTYQLKLLQYVCKLDVKKIGLFGRTGIKWKDDHYFLLICLLGKMGKTGLFWFSFAIRKKRNETKSVF